MKYALYHNLQPADRIVHALFDTGLSKHHAIFLGEDKWGQEWIAENNFHEGVRLTKAETFFRSQRKIQRIERFAGSHIERKNAVQRAMQLAGKPYSLLTYNCEHYANEVQYGKSESKQVQTFLGLAAGIFILSMFFSE
ncbi:MAG: lecithin retinol acyltransferase family protein [Candidatus Pseudobacter hemicellulosilyticus]|uniref:Lecithin retinol acyltransferase family protein n=1 Tax=Candidatus Pseudobacter hemicellulosilyticus TaxID=3121375 RepID=A0AAJ5WPS0_9BACT|nr:MAG: lecithin retinol acyltransferase family protein [Pseudobacter sp.]